MKGNPRYALVRVDGTTHCPSRYEKINRAFVCSGLPYCYKCRYGDTKEQLIRKVAQVLYRDELRFCIWAEDIKYLPKTYERCLEKATKIVEFLGVEE